MTRLLVGIVKMILAYVLATLVVMAESKLRSNKLLFDFTSVQNLDTWKEVSDTARSVGKSKASFVLQKTQVYQRAVFFAVLNPQPNGACFAGVETSVKFDANNYTAIKVKVGNMKGNMKSFKVNLVNEKSATNGRTYEQFYDLLEGEQDTVVTLPLEKFTADFRGKFDPTAPPLTAAPVIQLGLQVTGGVYSQIKQSGVTAVEIDSIELV